MPTVGLLQRKCLGKPAHDHAWVWGTMKSSDGKHQRLAALAGTYPAELTPAWAQIVFEFLGTGPSQ